MSNSAFKFKTELTNSQFIRVFIYFRGLQKGLTDYEWGLILKEVARIQGEIYTSNRFKIVFKREITDDNIEPCIIIGMESTLYSKHVLKIFLDAIVMTLRISSPDLILVY